MRWGILLGCFCFTSINVSYNLSCSHTLAINNIAELILIISEMEAMVSLLCLE